MKKRLQEPRVSFLNSKQKQHTCTVFDFQNNNFLPGVILIHITTEPVSGFDGQYYVGTLSSSAPFGTAIFNSEFALSFPKKYLNILINQECRVSLRIDYDRILKRHILQS